MPITVIFKIIRFVAALSLILFLIGCGGGGGGGSGSNNISNESLTPGGYPKVAGTYSFTTDKVSCECTDGSSETINKLSLHMDISQTESWISSDASLVKDIPGMTILEKTDLTGNIQKNGVVVLNKYLTAQIDGISGNVTVTYSVDGKFTDTGWSGNYEYVVFFQSLGSTCTYTTTFTGDKVNSANSAIMGTKMQDIDDADMNHILGTLIGY